MIFIADDPGTLVMRFKTFHVRAAWQHNSELADVNVAFHVALETATPFWCTQQFPNALDHDTHWLGKHPV